LQREKVDPTAVGEFTYTEVGQVWSASQLPDGGVDYSYVGNVTTVIITDKEEKFSYPYLHPAKNDSGLITVYPTPGIISEVIPTKAVQYTYHEDAQLWEVTTDFSGAPTADLVGFAPYDVTLDYPATFVYPKPGQLDVNESLGLLTVNPIPVHITSGLTSRTLVKRSLLPMVQTSCSVLEDPLKYFAIISGACILPLFCLMWCCRPRTCSQMGMYIVPIASLVVLCSFSTAMYFELKSCAGL